jgi:hypothetical protein
MNHEIDEKRSKGGIRLGLVPPSPSLQPTLVFWPSVPNTPGAAVADTPAIDPAPGDDPRAQPDAPGDGPLFPPDLLAVLGAATVRWANADRDDSRHHHRDDHGEALEGPELPTTQADDDGPSWRRLIGNGFPSRPTETPDPRIIADPVTLCPRCGSGPVLAELRAATGETCWPCWTDTHAGPGRDGRPSVDDLIPRTPGRGSGACR